MSKKRSLWVVEMQIEKEWSTTVGVAISRDNGRAELRQWREDNPHDSFRLVEYIPGELIADSLEARGQ